MNIPNDIQELIACCFHQTATISERNKKLKSNKQLLMLIELGLILANLMAAQVVLPLAVKLMPMKYQMTKKRRGLRKVMVLLILVKS